MDEPIWTILEHQGRSLKWLANRTEYSYSYVNQVRTGHVPLSEAFKRKCVWAMDLPRDVLFLLPKQEGGNGTTIKTEKETA